MTTFVFANNINTTLAGAVSTSATTITLSSTANLPASIPNGSVLVITLNDIATRQNYEIVYATAIAGATLTVLRGQEGTAALAWLVGDFAYSPPTAGQQASFGQLAGANTWTGNDTFNNPVSVGAALIPSQAVNLGQFPSSLSTQGFKKYPDPNSPSGFYIEQWGLNGTSNGFRTVTFPIAFPNALLNLGCTIASASSAGAFAVIEISGNPTGPNNANASFYSAVFGTPSGGPANGDIAFYWQAKGY